MKLLKKIGIIFLILIVIGAVGNAMGGSKKSDSSGKTESAVSESKVESVVDSSAEQTTETPAPSADAKSKRNGFDEATNQTFEYQGFAFSVPTYMTANSKDDGSVTFSFNGEAEGNAGLGLARQVVTYSAEDFENGKTELMNNIAKNANFTWQSTSAVTIAGCPGVFGTDSANTENGPAEIEVYVWYDTNNQALLQMTYVGTSQASYSYIDDIRKIAASAVYTGNGIAEEPTPEAEADTAGTDDANVPAGVTPEFKEQMDQYEAFFDEYIEFMEVYSNSDDPLSLMGEYLDFMQKYTECMAAIDAIDEAELSDADSLYFAQVTLRIEEKLLNVTASLY